MTQSPETFAISVEAAEVYEQKFVPALFAEWAPPLLDAAGARPGHAVLDVACGTGVVAREAARRVGPDGKVVGVDINPAMLTVARRLRRDIEWHQADVAELPFSGGSFDIVLCQSAMMFFPDVAQALQEMARVLTADGTVGVQVFSRLESQPAYGPFVELAGRYGGPEARNLLGTYWRLGDLAALKATFASAGLEVTGMQTRMGTVKFASIDELVRTEIEATPLIERISPETYHQILDEARQVLARFRTSTGRVDAPIEGHLVTAHRAIGG